ncbi:MAG: ribosome maturation factor RimM [Christensenellales bacterium]
MTDYIEVGKVLKPKGLKGAMKVEGITDDNSRFLRLKEIFISKNSYCVEKAQLDGNFVLLKLFGVDTPEDAEKLRNKSLFIKRADVVDMDADHNLIVDIIGMEVEVGNKIIGKISDVLQYGAADVYVVKCEKNEISFPALKKLVVSVDVENKKMTLDEKVFGEVAVKNEI